MARILAALLCIASSVSLLGGCEESSSSSERFDDAAAAVEGIYRLDSLAENLESCEPGGASLLDDGSERYLVVTRDAWLGLFSMSCTSPDDCRERIAALGSEQATAYDFGFQADELSDDGTVFTGELAWSGFNREGMCTEAAATRSSLRFEDGTLEIEERTSIAAPYPADADGACWSDTGYEHAKDEPCSRMLVGQATFVEAL